MIETRRDPIRLAIRLLDGKAGVERRRGVGVGDKLVGQPRLIDGVTEMALVRFGDRRSVLMTVAPGAEGPPWPSHDRPCRVAGGGSERLHSGKT